MPSSSPAISCIAIGGQPRLGVAVGGGIIAVDVAEIALAVDQRVAEREILGEADHRVVDRLVAVRMIFADHVADDACRFLVGAGGIEPKQPHRPQQPPVDRLQPVAHVRQRARGDRGQRINEVALAQRGVERCFDDGRNWDRACPCLASLSRVRRAPVPPVRVALFRRGWQWAAASRRRRPRRSARISASSHSLKRLIFGTIRRSLG